jgi:Na+/melibiose symporter-like transporter
LIGNNNNLLVTRLGASDFEISLVITLPQLVGMLVLIPGGILTDRMKNKRNMVVAALASLIVTYVLLGFAPMMGSSRLTIFLILLAISTGPMTIYNVAWQAYFSDVVDIETRNSVLTARTGVTFLVGTVITLCSGALLAAAGTVDQKIVIHQIFFWVAGVFLLLQIWVLRKIQSKEVAVSPKFKLQDLKTAFVELKANKKFLGFITVAIFFYVTWHIDWTLYFIGQVDYLGFNEAWLSYVNIGGAIMQFLTIGFWSRLNRKKGVRFAIIFGSLGLAIFPLAMIISTSISVSVSKPLFLILNIIANFAMATITLNILQCLLQVIPEKNKTLNISIYTVLVTLSNAFMPLAGVAIYTALGADLQALHKVFWSIFFLRIVSTSLWAMRYVRLRTEPM